GRKIRVKIHIAFSDTREAFQRGAIKPLAVLNTVGELFARNGDALCHSHDICKLQINKAHTLPLKRGYNLFRTLLCHMCTSSGISSSPAQALFAYYYLMTKVFMILECS